jgi:alkanesulfonate monooxygenase SsuD/methylene tetrahydromethanopterin reductase-like flavin-dependent oxidoreductase (luciferase family)
MGVGSGTDHLDTLERGFAKRGGRPADFEMFTGCTVRVTDDVAGALDGMRPLTAMYVGGMGSATHNFHRETMARKGFPDEAARIHELWMAGRKDEAIAAVPDAYLEQSAFLGDAQRIRRQMATWSPPAGTTGVIVDAPDTAELRLATHLRDGS